ncbi:MAG TPA: FAD-dependent oxidoreductase [Noviherbaspirillum sp.]|uniref:oxidoreductase n=1 Tax=Noviherbaspirillum sp. TaxID=1926288 RepID=UPI002B463FE8|nr:FAD-dependent oxidoreductase [Noviherbaspirillum sp.]HJV86588.1 FAD-dependent oxidoreductase [Noviherbaspirillum sp.]
MALTHVLQPISIGGVSIPNRVVRSAHGTRFGGGLMSDDLIAYHALRARGGVGLSILEIMAVHPSSPSGLNGFDPRIGEGFGRLLDAVRPHGMRLFQQIWHGGHHTMPQDGGPPWSASDIPGPRLGVAPVPMTRAMIDEIVDSYARTARMCQELGLDGVEIHAAHGYLIHQFLSPATNQREDDYGGSFDNRIRFLLDVVTAVRAAVRPGSFAVGVRLAPDMSAGGWNEADVLRVAHLLESRGLIDFVHVSQGSYHAFDKMIGGMHEPSGYELPLSRRVTRELSVPRIVVGRFRTLEEADQAIRDGDADMVAMTRATIADPMLVRKTIDGKVEQVRPCIACNQGCVGNLLTVGRMGCVVNPAVGHELRFGEHLLRPATEKRHVVVIGGGPAGMEAARVAALRGHRVTLCEAQPELGGALRLAARGPTRHGIIDLATWLEQEIYRLGVQVNLSTYVDAADVLGMRPDSVVVATGSVPRMDGMQMANPGEPVQGMAQRHVRSSWEVLSDPKVADKVESAVVVDDLGHYEAIAVAEYLVQRGITVHYVSRHIAFAPLVEPALMTEPALRRLDQRTFRQHLRSRVVRIDPDSVLIGSTYSPGEDAATVLPAQLVVFVSLNRSVRDLYEELRTNVQRIELAGDARSPRQLQQAMLEGHRAGAAA